MDNSTHSMTISLILLDPNSLGYACSWLSWQLHATLEHRLQQVGAIIVCMHAQWLAVHMAMVAS
jgi:hypothetical protein